MDNDKYCGRCDGEAVENYCMGNKFYYCRTCKIEVYQPKDRKSSHDYVVLSELKHFYTDNQNIAHCAFCGRGEGEVHTSKCGRNSSYSFTSSGIVPDVPPPIARCDHMKHSWAMTFDPDIQQIVANCSNCGVRV